MAKRPKGKTKRSTKCMHNGCNKPEAKGYRGLCYEHWKAFRRDKARQGAKVTTLTAKEQREGLTLKQKRLDAMRAWDDAQVALNRLRPGHRGLQVHKAAFGEAS